jgi:hypothetical protein
MTKSASAYALVNATTPTVQVTITNSGTGNKALAVVSGGATLNNLNGSISSTGSFTGSGSSVVLGDAYGGPASTKTFNFSPTGITTKGQVVSGSAVATFSNGTNANNAAGSLTATLTATGVAPVRSVSATSSVMARVGTSATATVSVSNVGDGNKAATQIVSGTTLNNLNGTISNTLGSGFSANGGNPTSISLGDAYGGPASSTTLGYTFSPVSRGTSGFTTTFSFSNGNQAGTNLSESVPVSVSAQGVGPEFQSKLGLTTNTPTAVAGGATASSGPTINFGSVAYNMTTTLYLELANITSDANGGNDALTDLTLKSFTIWGPDASKFSVGLSPGTVVHKGASVFLPISVLSTTLGMLSGSLTIFTDQTASLGGVGDTFTYVLMALVPEPTSIAVLGGGLLGLAALRKRRRRTAEPVA